jgi:hypothetical protein
LVKGEVAVKKTEKDADSFHFPRAIMSWPMLLIGDNPLGRPPEADCINAERDRLWRVRCAGCISNIEGHDIMARRFHKT